MEHTTQQQYADRQPSNGPARPATCWLNYRGHVVPDPYKPMGPNLLGELLWPVDIQPDVPEPGWTCVGFSLIAPPGVQIGQALSPDGLARAAAGR